VQALVKRDSNASAAVVFVYLVYLGVKGGSDDGVVRATYGDIQKETKCGNTVVSDCLGLLVEEGLIEVVSPSTYRVMDWDDILTE